MFRITPTYYTRSCDPTLLELDGPVSGGPNVSVASRSAAARLNASTGSLTSTFRHSFGVDRPTSILSFRGSTFTDIVESEQLCFICYDNAPGAALLECGHAGMCVDCAVHLMERPGRQARCPICRTHISNALRLLIHEQVPQHFFNPRARPSADQSMQQGSLTLSASMRSSSMSRGPHDRHARSVATEPGCDLEANAQNAAEAVSEAAAVGIEVGQPLAVPPWPLAARRFAVMVEALRRPADRGWRTRLTRH